MEREKIEQRVREVLATESQAVSLSNKLFSPEGLFIRLARTDEERRALVQSPLFKEAQQRFSNLQEAEAREFVRSLKRTRTTRPDEIVSGRDLHPGGSDRDRNTPKAVASHAGIQRQPLTDTRPEAEKILIELYRRMPAWQKLQQVCDLNRTVEMLALGEIRRRHPEAGERELRLRLGSRWLSAETMRTVFGWDPETEGY